MMSQVGHNVHTVRPRLLMIVEKAQFIAIGLYRDVWIAAIASSTTSLATRTAAICVCFQGRRVRRVYVTMQITFLTRKSALIYRRGLRQRVASITLNCNVDFAIRAYCTFTVQTRHHAGRSLPFTPWCKYMLSTLYDYVIVFMNFFASHIHDHIPNTMFV